jgi:hypothetical protein
MQAETFPDYPPDAIAHDSEFGYPARNRHTQPGAGLLGRPILSKQTTAGDALGLTAQRGKIAGSQQARSARQT